MAIRIVKYGENEFMKHEWKRNAVLYLVSQTISLFGSSLVQYAITWYITRTTQSGAMMTIAIICGFLPAFFLAPFSGVWADRYDRKKLIALSDGLIAAATLLLAIVFMMGYNAIWLLFVISAIRAVGSGIQTPAVGAFLPQIVPEEKLVRVNAVNGSVQSMVMLVSPMLSAVLLTYTTMEVIFFIDVVTAALAIFIVLVYLKVPAHERAKERMETTYFADLREGIRYIRQHAYVRSFFTYCTLFFFLIAPVAFLSPLQVTRTFGDEYWRLTAIEISFSLGMIIGGLIMASWGGLKNKVHSMILAFLVFGGCTLALGLMPLFWPYLAFMLISGLFMPFFNTPATVLLQQKVEPEYLGRVFGIMGMISTSMMPLGMLLFGPLADVISVEWLLIATGTLMLLQSLFMFRDKALIEAGKPMIEEKV